MYTYIHIHIYIHRLPRWHSGKESTCQRRRCKKRRFDPWVGKMAWSVKWQPASVFLPGKFHGQRSREGYHPWGHRVRQDWATKHAHTCAHAHTHTQTHTHTHYIFFIHSPIARHLGCLPFLTVCAQLLSHVWLFVTPWTGSTGSFVHRFPRQEYRNGLLLLSPGVLTNPGTEPTPLSSPALADSFFTTEPPGKRHYTILDYCK